ncbi:hypothetical protein [Comamonas thiooxydans]|uniref:hypothetical protein n=1 Tax=Comamonas thiooxydans TaxID=363952 RepID=UPI000B41FAF3|nr:hypothetical protein [Comamonas thiooxydans]
MNNTVRIDVEDQTYTIETGSSVSVMSFDHVFHEAVELTKRLKKRGIVHVPPTERERGSLELFEHRMQLLAVYEKINDSETWFDGRTPTKVRTALESLRRSGHKARIIAGDPETGLDWFSDEFSVGRVSRSGGAMKGPIMLTDSQYGGPLINTASIVKIIDLTEKCELFCHKGYHQNELSIEPGDRSHELRGHSHVVLQNGEYGWAELRGCKSLTEAEHVVAFLQGRSSIPV